MEEGEGREGKCWSPMLSPPTAPTAFSQAPKTSDGSCPRLLAGVHCSYIALVAWQFHLQFVNFYSSSRVIS